MKTISPPRHDQEPKTGPVISCGECRAEAAVAFPRQMPLRADAQHYAAAAFFAER
jgi:hypothetical protein